MSCAAIYHSPEPNIFAGDVRLREQDSESCSSSSIGRNSGVPRGSSDGDDEGDGQSSYKGPLDNMDALEKGISKFYSGISMSFTSLADASNKELAKPENHYTRKLKNLLAHSNF